MPYHHVSPQNHPGETSTLADIALSFSDKENTLAPGTKPVVLLPVSDAELNTSVTWKHSAKLTVPKKALNACTHLVAFYLYFFFKQPEYQVSGPKTKKGTKNPSIIQDMKYSTTTTQNSLGSENVSFISFIAN